ncbi:hypothetical protein X975_15545, partial [Stegodyphus mimosarum]
MRSWTNTNFVLSHHQQAVKAVGKKLWDNNYSLKGWNSKHFGSVWWRFRFTFCFPKMHNICYYGPIAMIWR